MLRDIHIRNVLRDGAEEAIFVRGLPEVNIRDTDASKAVRHTAFQYGAVPKALELN